MLNSLRSLAAGLLDAALPQTCAACGVWLPAGAGIVCRACHDEVVTGLARPYCPRCARTLPRPAIQDDGCARCRFEPFWNMAGVARVGVYEPALRALLVGLKYHGRERSADYLAARLADALAERDWHAGLDALAPVPMHWLRRVQRPCDHAAILATALGRRLRLPVVRPLWRARHARSQTTLPSKAARFENVQHCFAAAPWYWPPWPKPRVAGKTVCIVDNLAAAGATLVEVSKVLRRAGARRIYAAVVARPAAPGDPPTDPTAVSWDTGSHVNG